MKKKSIAIVGATGLVGGTLLSILESGILPFDKLFFVASQQSAGKTISFKGEAHSIHDLTTFDFSQTQLCFFCVGIEQALKYAPIAAAAGNIVIDKSSAYRSNVDVALIVPEVNMDAYLQHKNKQIIASPNCSTIPIAVGLKPIYDAVGITRINISTYQSFLGTGKDAIAELTEQSKALLENKAINSQVYPQQIAFNILPHIDDFEPNGYTKEEMKVINEMKKIFADDNMQVNTTAVRVPVYYGHAASVHLETSKKITAKEAMDLLSKAPGIKLVTGEFPYPTPVNDAAGNDLVYIGRVREDISHPNGLNLWIVADNLRKGAALNAIQIANHLIGQ